MTPEELEELKLTLADTEAGYRDPGELNELLGAHAKELILAIEECEIDRDYMAECRFLEKENEKLKEERDTLLKENDKLCNILSEIEWPWLGENCCEICGAYKHDGHDSNCKLKGMLK